MNTYLVERYLPGVAEGELRSALGRAQTICAELRAAGTEVRYLGSIFLPLEEACFCRFEGDSEETIAQVNRRAELGFARITAAVMLRPEMARPAG